MAPNCIYRECMHDKSLARWPPIREILQFIEATIALAVASLAVRFVPFRVITRTLEWGEHDFEKDPRRADALAAEVSVAVRRASRRSPWRNVCIHRGLATQWMLRRRGLDARFHYGLSHTNSVLSAHVWVSLNGLVVMGEEEASHYKCVAEFPARISIAGQSET